MVVGEMFDGSKQQIVGAGDRAKGRHVSHNWTYYRGRLRRTKGYPRITEVQLDGKARMCACGELSYLLVIVFLLFFKKVVWDQF